VENRSKNLKEYPGEMHPYGTQSSPGAYNGVQVNPHGNTSEPIRALFASFSEEGSGGVCFKRATARLDVGL
jgi:hypothetical protein